MSKLLKEFEENGIVKCKKARPQGYKRKVKTYQLSQGGVKKAEKIYDETFEHKTGSDLKKTGKTVEEILDVLISRNEKNRGRNEEEPKKASKSQKNADQKLLFSSIRGYLSIAISLILISIAPVMNFYNFTSSIYYFLSLTIGLILVKYLIYALKSDMKKIRQIYSTVIFVNFAFIINSIIGGNTTADLIYYFIVFFSIMIFTFIGPQFLNQKYLLKSMKFITFILIILGFIFSFSFVFLKNFSGIYWLIFGLYMFEATQRWGDKSHKTISSITGLGGLYTVVLMAVIISNYALTPIELISVIGWIFVGITLAILEFVFPEKKKKMFFNFQESIPAIFLLLFSSFVILLFLTGRYLGGFIELLLSIIILYYILRNRKLSILNLIYGVIITALSILTIIVLLI